MLPEKRRVFRVGRTVHCDVPTPRNVYIIELLQSAIFGAIDMTCCTPQSRYTVFGGWVAVNVLVVSLGETRLPK